MPPDLSNGERHMPICLCEVELWKKNSRDGFHYDVLMRSARARVLPVELRCLLSFNKLAELLRAFSDGTYRICLTPGCPGVYQVVDLT